jgi:hypothetical protein
MGSYTCQVWETRTGVSVIRIVAGAVIALMASPSDNL